MELDLVKRIITQRSLKTFKEDIEKYLLENIRTKGSKYLIEEEIPYVDFGVKINKYNFIWSEIESFQVDQKLHSEYSLSLNLHLEAQLKIEDKITTHFYEKDKVFDLKCYIFFSLQKSIFSFSILTEREQLLQKIHDEILEIYKREGIKDLNPNTGIGINGKNYLQFFIDITHKKRTVNVNFNSFGFFNDLEKKIIDIRFLLANMYMHKPFIWNFLANNYKFNGEDNFYYYPSFHDTRYMTYCDLLFQSVYNYWDKIGDLLAKYFTPELREKSIFFKTIIEKIPQNYRENENYIWLNNFLNDQYFNLNEKRKLTVHYRNYTSSFHEQWLKNISNKEEIQKLQTEKCVLTDYFKTHLDLSITGFEKALKLIDEIE